MTVPQGGLLALVGTSTPVGYNATGGFMQIDFANDRAFQMQPGPLTGAQGFKQFAVGTAGTETAQATAATIMTPHTMINAGWLYHPMGQLFITVDGGNSCPIAKIDATALTLTEIIGTSTSSLALSTCNDLGVVTRLVLAFRLIALQRQSGMNTTDYFATSSRSREVDIVNVTTTGSPLLLSAALVPDQSVTVGRGNSGSAVGTATFYAIGHVFNFGSGSPAPISLYKYSITGDTIAAAEVYSLPNSAVARAMLVSIAPSNVDPAWTNFTAVSAPGYDNADGNIIVAFQTQDAVTNQSYLCKLNGSTGAFMWRTPVPRQVAAFIAPEQSNINRYFATFYGPLAGDSVVQVWDLSTGIYTSQTWNRGINAITNQIFDIGTFSLSGGTGYSVGSGPVPDYLGSYLAANANTIPAYRFGRIFLGDLTSPPSVVPHAPYGYTRVWGSFP